MDHVSSGGSGNAVKREADVRVVVVQGCHETGKDAGVFAPGKDLHSGPADLLIGIGSGNNSLLAASGG